MPSGRLHTDLRRLFWHLRNYGVKHTWGKVRSRYLLTSWTGLRPKRGARGHLTFEPWPLRSRPPKGAVRVGVILDDFSRLSFGAEWQQILLKPSSWRELLSTEPVDLLFVESAWAGNGGAWKYHLTGPSAPRDSLVELVRWCQERGIPTVFWNKEDPAHFEDFLDTASLFDHVFTTDINTINAYRRRLGHDRVHVLTFAAAQTIHNPIRAHGNGPIGDVAFAGMYFAHRYPERRAQMELLLGAACNLEDVLESGLDIYSRMLGDNPDYQFPEPYKSRVAGSLSYPEMLTAYREYKVFLNVNSITDSPTMCARRIFEITASGTPVVSTPSAAIGEFFSPDEVFVVESQEQAENTIKALVRSKEVRDRATHRAQRRIWRNHTYSHRAAKVLDVAGFTEQAHQITSRPSVSSIVSTNRPHQVEHVLKTFAAQRDCEKQLLLLTHGFELKQGELRSRARDLGIENFTLLFGDPGLYLGECLNKLVEAAEGDVITKMDDDDLYGPNYLNDQLSALGYSGADVVGKQAHYMHLESSGATMLRFPEREHRFTDFVMGPTIMAWKETMKSHPFAKRNRGEDSDLLRDFTVSGCSVYSSDRFNFVQIRKDTDGNHTWNITDAEVLATGTVVFYGEAQSHVFV